MEPLAASELLDSVHHQWQRIFGTAGKGVCGTDSRRDERCVGDELLRSAEVQSALEDAGGAWQIPASEVGEAKKEQPPTERKQMIGLFSDLHGGLGLSDRL